MHQPIEPEVRYCARCEKPRARDIDACPYCNPEEPLGQRSTD